MDCFVASAPRNDGLAASCDIFNTTAAPGVALAEPGQISSDFRKSCQAPESKIFRFTIRKIRIISSVTSSPRRGVGHRHQGWDGMRWTRQRRACLRLQGEMKLVSDRTAHETSDAVAYGEAVWSWHPLLMPSLRRRSWPNRASGAANSQMTVTKGIRRRGERGVSRKAIARGMSECYPLPCMLVCANAQSLGTRDRGCSAHPAFPAPSFFKRGTTNS
jgi:hypothetical protein